MDLAPLHSTLGTLYITVGQLENAREHYEQGAQYFEKTGNHFDAGRTRHCMAQMYAQAAVSEAQSSQKRSGLLRARAYAEAALRDYRYYQGRAANEEALAQALIDYIDQDLA